MQFLTPGLPFIPTIAITVNIYLIFKLSILTLVRFTVWMSLGLIMYFYYGITHSSLENPTEEIELRVDDSYITQQQVRRKIYLNYLKYLNYFFFFSNQLEQYGMTDMATRIKWQMMSGLARTITHPAIIGQHTMRIRAGMLHSPATTISQLHHKKPQQHPPESLSDLTSQHHHNEPQSRRPRMASPCSLPRRRFHRGTTKRKHENAISYTLKRLNCLLALHYRFFYY